MRIRSSRPELLLGAIALLAALPLAAHTLPLETTAYFKIDGGGLRVLVRLPMVSLSDAKLPVNARGSLDLEAGRSAFDAAAAEFVRSVDIMDGGRPLPAPRISWVVSGKNDLSFESHATAAARLTQTAFPDLSPNEGFLDLQLDYPLTSAAPRLSIRFNGQRANGEFIPTRAIYLTAQGDERRFAIVGPPHRVSFEPSGLDVTAMSLRRGAGRLVSEQKLLLFLVCVLIPLRPASTTLKLVGAMLASYVATGAVVAMLPVPPDLPLQLLCQLAASIALATAALQNMQSPRLMWVRSIVVIFGAASGIGVGLAARDLRPFAGSWDVEGLTLFLGTVTLGVLLLMALLRFVIGVVISLVRRLPVPASAAAILLSLVPLHTALHEIQDDGQQLSEAGASGGHNLLTAAVANWPPIVLVLTLGFLVIATRRAAGIGATRAAGGPHQR